MKKRDEKKNGNKMEKKSIKKSLSVIPCIRKKT